ncbi:interleukin-1 beta-like [Pleurodeles waltl]|uniref:interleukin-1 beta-like n=1 Tax=Pleurodeles waltl TaxID=8319 RepID=UPI0037094144
MSLVPEMGAELMESYSESNDSFYEADGICDMMASKVDASLGSCPRDCTSCRSSIKVKVTTLNEPSTFRRAVVVVVAVEKMKRGVFNASEGCHFGDSDLLEIFGRILVEDEISIQTFEETFREESLYRHFSSTVQRITDTDNKRLALNEFSGQAQLVALHLQGPNAERQVKLNMSFYSSPSPSGEKRPVTLGIVGKQLHLSCVMVGTTPELRLEEVSGILTSIKTDLLRFVFFKVDASNSSSFESASCPGWFISTSQDPNQPVLVSEKTNPITIQNFKLSED